MQSKYQTTLKRFYIAEAEATRAEKILQQAQINNNALLTVSINKKGEAKIVDLLIDGKPIADLLKIPDNTRNTGDAGETP